MLTRSATHRIPLQLRQLRQGVVLVRASNDTVVDEYGTTITVEALMRDWLPAFLQHRTVGLPRSYRSLVVSKVVMPSRGFSPATYSVVTDLVSLQW